MRNAFGKFFITQFDLSRRPNWENIFLTNSQFYYLYRTFSVKLMWFFAEWITAGLSEVQSMHSERETSWRKPFFWKVRVVWIVSKYERKLIARLLKLPSKCPMERFDEKLFFGKTSFFWWGFHTLGKTFLGFSERNWQDCQKSTLRLRWNMLKKMWFTWKCFEVFIKFGLWTKEIKSRCVKPVF